MTEPRDVNRVVRSWLDEGVDRLPDRVMDGVLEQLPATPQRRRRWPTWLSFSPAVPAPAAVALTVVLAVVLGGALVGLVGPRLGWAPGPRPTPTPQPTELPRFGVLEPGRYVVGEPFPLQLVLDLPGGFSVWTPASVDSVAIYRRAPDPPDGGGIGFALVDNLFADPCQPGQEGMDPPLGPTIDDLAEGLAAQPGTEASATSEVTVDGYQARYVELVTTGLGTDGCPAPTGRVYRYGTAGGDRQTLDGERVRAWIVDVEGARLLIDLFTFPGTSAAAQAELEQIVEDLQLAP
jgi:hypothetical protein